MENSTPIKFLILLFLSLVIGCQKIEPIIDDPDKEIQDPDIEEPVERLFEAAELVGRYCGTNSSNNEFVDEFSVEILNQDTLKLIGNWDYTLYEIEFFIRNDSLIFPRQVKSWTNESPGGATWEEWRVYEGNGVYKPETGLIEIHLIRDKERGTSNGSIVFKYALLSTSDISISGMFYSIDSSNDSALITEIAGGDSAIVSLFFDYQNSTDSLLRSIVIENPTCEVKRIFLALNPGMPLPKYYLSGPIRLNKDTLTVDFNKLVYTQSGLPTQNAPYYYFKGVNRK